MVDTVLAFEGDRGQPYRILRAVKNRFGPTNEVGRVPDDRARAWPTCPDPSSLFLEEGRRSPGSSVVAAMEGTRCLLAEVQALVTPTTLAMPRRVTRGVDRNRLGDGGGGAGAGGPGWAWVSATSSSMWPED